MIFNPRHGRIYAAIGDDPITGLEFLDHVLMLLLFPLLRFDGYYILSDLLDIPNLSTRAFKHLRHLMERYLFGYRDSSGYAASMKEAVWLTA